MLPQASTSRNVSGHERALQARIGCAGSTACCASCSKDSLLWNSLRPLCSKDASATNSSISLRRACSRQAARKQPSVFRTGLGYNPVCMLPWDRHAHAAGAAGMLILLWTCMHPPCMTDPASSRFALRRVGRCPTPACRLSQSARQHQGSGTGTAGQPRLRDAPGTQG